MDVVSSKTRVGFRFFSSFPGFTTVVVVDAAEEAAGTDLLLEARDKILLLIGLLPID